MKGIGIFLLGGVLSAAAYYLFVEHAELKKVSAFSAIGVFAALILLLGDRITKVRVSGVGEITAAEQRAVASAERVEKIEKDIENHRDSIAMIVRDANVAREDIKKVADSAKDAETKAKDAEKLVKDAQQSVLEIRDVSDYSFVATKALNDDRDAFQQLMDFANNPASKFNRYALNTLVQIVNDPQVTGMISTSSVDWDLIKVNPKAATWDELNTIFHQGKISPLWRPCVLQAIWQEDRFPIVQRGS